WRSTTPSRRCCRSSGRARCVLSACLPRCRPSRGTSRWGGLMCFRYRTRAWGGGTGGSSPLQPAQRRGTDSGGGAPRGAASGGGAGGEGKGGGKGGGGRRGDLMTCSGV